MKRSLRKKRRLFYKIPLQLVLATSKPDHEHMPPHTSLGVEPPIQVTFTRRKNIEP